MKTIIIYATKYGAAGEIARRIAGKMDGAAIHELNQNIPSLADFDCVIFGSSIYAGMIRRKAKMFLSKNANVLKEKKLGLFLSGLDAAGEKKYFDSNFSREILEKAKATSFLGGVFDPKKAGMLERLVMKVVSGRSVYVNTINDGKIEQFVNTMKA